MILSGITDLNRPSPNTKEVELLEALEINMKTFEDYTNPTLSLKDLSERLDITTKQLSYLINTFHDKNFMTFVNDYRLEKAKSRLINPKDKGETVLEIMYDVGFNSKSSFFTLFKLNTGLTPTAFKKKHASPN